MLDFSDNDITKIEGFPSLPRLTSLLVNNNKVALFGEGLGSKLPNLDTLVLTNNRVANLADLDNLADFKNLRSLSLIKNPVSQIPNYRLYVVHKLPNLKILDFQKVKAKVC